MKVTKLVKFALLVLAGVAAFAPAAKAANAVTNPRDLLLTFLSPGDDHVVIASLGNVETLFRDATPGSFTLSNVNLSAALTAAYGSSWYENSALWMGAVANVQSFRSSNPAAMAQLDPAGTVYASVPRTAAGSVGAQNSSTYTISFGSNPASLINGVFNNIETSGTGAIATFAKSATVVDDYNTFVGDGQSLAYSTFGNGVQGQFGIGSFGSFGAAGNVELALDLFRYQEYNNVTGQYGFGDSVNTGKFLGTLTIDQSGQVGFYAVPEPTTTALAGAALAAMAFRRRRRQA